MLQYTTEGYDPDAQFAGGGVFGSDEEDVDMPFTPSDLDEEITVCCDRPAEACLCRGTLLFSDVDERFREFVINTNSRVYDTSCDECIFRFTVGCEPYRNLLYIWDGRESVDIEGALSQCADYESRSEHTPFGYL